MQTKDIQNTAPKHNLRDAMGFKFVNGAEQLKQS